MLCPVQQCNKTMSFPSEQRLARGKMVPGLYLVVTHYSLPVISSRAQNNREAERS